MLTYAGEWVGGGGGLDQCWHLLTGEVGEIKKGQFHADIIYDSSH